MIVVDTSALVAVMHDESNAVSCMEILSHTDAIMSAGTYAESLVVSLRRDLRSEMTQLVDGLGIEIVPVTAADAHRVAHAYETYGKVLHKAGLNFGDCFAYALARVRGCPLLYVGNDFAHTDIEPALPPP